MHKLPKLSYNFNSLEPYIDGVTMEIHHDRHHAAYVTNLNNALKEVGGELAELDIISLLQRLDEVPNSHKTAIRNNGGGHFNHSLFWELLSGTEAGMPSTRLSKGIQKDFGSFEKFQEAFAKAAATRFGSGWAWLIVNPEGRLEVYSTPNQDNPITEGAGVPILGLDVWEHAYYLKYQNKRPEYIKAFWNVVDWQEVSTRYEKAVDSYSKGSTRGIPQELHQSICSTCEISA